MYEVSDVIAEFVSQARHPPGGDLYISACYHATVALYCECPPMAALIDGAFSVRRPTPKHFVNLYFRSIQYIELYVCENAAYPDQFPSQHLWRAELIRILESHFDLLKYLLTSRQTVTTQYQRYAGPRAIIAAWFAARRITVADFGCGANHGLAGMAISEPFLPILDHTKGQLINRLLGQPVRIQGIGIDREAVRDNPSREWLNACSFYPSELEKLPQFETFSERLASSPVDFLQCDLLSLSANGKPTPFFSEQFDAIVMSTFLYQLMAAEREQVLEVAKSLLKQTGILIIQDFVRKNDHDLLPLDFDGSWFSGDFNYRTLITSATLDWYPAEVLMWSNGRCREVKEGMDFCFLESRLNGSRYEH